MTADELARVTAERDAAVAALAGRVPITWSPDEEVMSAAEAAEKGWAQGLDALNEKPRADRPALSEIDEMRRLNRQLENDVERLTSQRNQAVTALARVEALADRWREAGGYTRCTCYDSCTEDLSRALAGPEGDAGGEVAPDFVALPCGCEVVERTPHFGDLPERPTYALGEACDEHIRDYGVSDDELREAIGRAKKAAETRAGDS